jgi:hypothetical protein
VPVAFHAGNVSTTGDRLPVNLSPRARSVGTACEVPTVGLAERPHPRRLPLASASRSGHSIVAHGQNRVTFRDLRHRVSVADAPGQIVRAWTEAAGDFTHVSFQGRGPHAVTLRSDVPYLACAPAARRASACSCASSASAGARASSFW